jgi:hypothetical protein
MDKKYLLVISHPRSGTHFCINSLCLNFSCFDFDYVREGYPTLENFFWEHDKDYIDSIKEYANKESNNIKIFKTHLLASDLKYSVSDESKMLKDYEKEVLKDILDNSAKLYVYRDGKDVMVSWNHFLRTSSGGLIADTSRRIEKASFSEFIRMPNKLIFPIRAYNNIDENRVKYWSEHISEWLSEDGILGVRFEDLKDNCKESMLKAAEHFGIEKHLEKEIAPPPPPTVAPDFCTRVLRKFGINLKKQTLPPANFRKGITGDHKNVFSPDDLEFFYDQSKKVKNLMNY